MDDRAISPETSAPAVSPTGDAIRFRQARAMAAIPWLAHGVTERMGGVSGGEWSSLNLGLHVGDDPERVVENRRRAAAALGFDPGDMVCAEQVHGGRVARIDRSDAGRGARVFAEAVAGVDALVTDVPGLLPTLFFADCVPVLLADPVRRAVGVAHGGWRGLVEGVVGATVREMREAFGSDPADLLGAVGPCIGACCYEVGPEVAERFGPEFRREEAGRTRLDLAAAAAAMLAEAGLKRENIEVAGDCTCCDTALFSHRRDRGKTGRIAAMIGIRR